MRLTQAIGMPLSSESDAKAAHGGRPIKAMLGGLLAAPDHLHRFAHGLGDLDCLGNIIGFHRRPKTAPSRVVLISIFSSGRPLAWAAAAAQES